MTKHYFLQLKYSRKNNNLSIKRVRKHSLETKMLNTKTMSVCANSSEKKCESICKPKWKIHQQGKCDEIKCKCGEKKEKNRSKARSVRLIIDQNQI